MLARPQASRSRITAAFSLEAANDVADLEAGELAGERRPGAADRDRARAGERLSSSGPAREQRS